MLPREQMKLESVPKESGTGEGGVKASDDEDDVNEAVGKRLFEDAARGFYSDARIERRGQKATVERHE